MWWMDWVKEWGETRIFSLNNGVFGWCKEEKGETSELVPKLTRETSELLMIEDFFFFW